MEVDWPATDEELIALQERLARIDPAPFVPSGPVMHIGVCFVCFPRHTVGPGASGDLAWAVAVLSTNHRVRETVVVTGAAGAPYRPGLLARREGPILETAVRALGEPPEVILVNATGRDHPRGAGLALHLGAILDIPTVAVTHRTLLATGDLPRDERGATTPLTIDDEHVGCWLRTRAGSRPLAVGSAWRTDVETATRVVMAAIRRARTPEPLRRALRAARRARAEVGPGSSP